LTAAAFLQFNPQQLGAKLLRFKKNKGWLVPPPLHVDHPEK